MPNIERIYTNKVMSVTLLEDLMTSTYSLCGATSQQSLTLTGKPCISLINFTILFSDQTECELAYLQVVAALILLEKDKQLNPSELGKLLGGINKPVHYHIAEVNV